MMMKKLLCLKVKIVYTSLSLRTPHIYVVTHDIVYIILLGPLDYASIATLPLFFGKAVYAYEGIGIVSI